MLLLSAPALADRGALTFDLGGGGVGWNLPAPYAAPPKGQPVVAFHTMLGARYALSNWLELGVLGFYEPTLTVYHSGVTVPTDDGAFPGTLSHTYGRYGVVAGVYYKAGSILRPTVGLEVGWAHRSYASFHLYNVDDLQNPVDYGLSLPAYSADNVVVGAALGLEWCFADHWSASATLKPQGLLGPDPTFAVVGALTLSFSWYL